MCDTIQRKVDDEWINISNLSDIKAQGWIVEPDDAFEIATGQPWQDSWCLCGVDVEAILARNNVLFTYDITGGWIVDS